MGGLGIYRLAVGFGSVWVVDAERGQVLRVDAREHRRVARLSLGVSDVVVGERVVWAVGETSVARIDPATSAVVGRTAVGPLRVVAAAAGEGSLWVAAWPPAPAAHPFGGALLRIEERAGGLLGAAVLPGLPAEALVGGAGAVCAGDDRSHLLHRLDLDDLREVAG